MCVFDSGRKTVDSEGVSRINSIIMDITPLKLDIERFKEVNDLNGHAYGDHVLIRTARILEVAT